MDGLIARIERNASNPPAEDTSAIRSCIEILRQSRDSTNDGGPRLETGGTSLRTAIRAGAGARKAALLNMQVRIERATDPNGVNTYYAVYKPIKAVAPIAEYAKAHDNVNAYQTVQAPPTEDAAAIPSAIEALRCPRASTNNGEPRTKTGNWENKFKNWN